MVSRFDGSSIPTSLREAAQEYLTTKANGHAVDLLSREKRLIFPTVYHFCAQLAFEDPPIQVRANYRLNLLGTVIRQGLAGVNDLVVSTQGQVFDPRDPEHAEAISRPLRTLMALADSDAILQWLYAFPELTGQIFDKISGSYDPYSECGSQSDRLAVLLRRHLTLRAFEVGPEVALLEVEFAQFLLASGHALDEDNATEILRQVSVVCGLFTPHFTLQQQIRYIGDNPDLLDSRIFERAKMLLDVLQDTEQRTNELNALEMLGFAIEGGGIDGAMNGAVRAVLNETDQARAKRLVNEFVDLVDTTEDFRIVLDNTYTGTARFLALKRIAELREAQELRKERVRRAAAEVLTARSWAEVEHILQTNSLLEIRARRLLIGTAATGTPILNLWNGYPLLELLGDIEELGVRSGIQQAIRKQTGVEFAQRQHPDAHVINVYRGSFHDRVHDPVQYAELDEAEERAGDLFGILNENVARTRILAEGESPSLEEIDRSLLSLEQDLYYRRRSDERRGRTHLLRGLVLVKRFEMRGDYADLNAAALAFRNGAMYELTPGTRLELCAEWVQAECLLIDFRQTLFNLHDSVDGLNSALRLVEGEKIHGSTHGLSYYFLARALMEIDSRLPRSNEDFERSHAMLSAALRNLGSYPQQYAQATISRASLFALSYEITGDGQYLRDGLQWVQSTLSQGMLGDHEHLLDAFKHFAVAELANSADSSPIQHMVDALASTDTAKAPLGRHLLQLEGMTEASAGNWPVAASIMKEWTESVYSQTLLQLSIRDRNELQKHLAGATALTARALVEVGDPNGAAIALERSRSVAVRQFSLASALGPTAREQWDNPGVRETIQRYLRLMEIDRRLRASQATNGAEPVDDGLMLQRARDSFNEVAAELPGLVPVDDFWDYEAISRTTAKRPVVYVTAGKDTGLAVVCRKEGAHAVRLPELTDGYVRETLAATYGRGWDATSGLRLDRFCGELWQRFVDPLLDAVNQDEEFVLVPNGVLSGVPFHAAWRTDKDRRSGRLFAIDILGISYAGSAALLDRASRIGNDALPKDAVFIGASGETAKSLRFSDLEANALQSFVPNAQVRRQGVERGDLVQALERGSWVHFSGHARVDVSEPLNGYLELNDGGRLTLRQIEGIGGVAGATIVLSACESALQGVNATDEAVGMPSALMMLGAARCVGSLWRVPQASTAEIVIRMYQYLSVGDTLRVALRKAQMTCRDSTLAEKQELFSRLDSTFPGFGPAESLPGANIRAWGGFGLFGA
jgi:CHAT domain-containing protein